MSEILVPDFSKTRLLYLDFYHRWQISGNIMPSLTLGLAPKMCTLVSPDSLTSDLLWKPDKSVNWLQVRVNSRPFWTHA